MPARRHSRLYSTLMLLVLDCCSSPHGRLGFGPCFFTVTSAVWWVSFVSYSFFHVQTVEETRGLPFGQNTLVYSPLPNHKFLWSIWKNNNSFTHVGFESLWWSLSFWGSPLLPFIFTIIGLNTIAIAFTIALTFTTIAFTTHLHRHCSPRDPLLACCLPLHSCAEPTSNWGLAGSCSFPSTFSIQFPLQYPVSAHPSPLPLSARFKPHFLTMLSALSFCLRAAVLLASFSFKLFFVSFQLKWQVAGYPRKQY